MTTFNSTFSTITVSNQKKSSDFDIAVSDQRDMDELVASFQARNRDQSGAVSSARRAFETASQDALYDMLALAYAICLAMLEQGNLRLTLAILREHGFNGLRKGANEFGLLVQILFGRWTEKKDDKTGNTVRKFLKNRSAEKYAKALRLLKAKGIKPENAAAYIATFEGKMQGVLNEDTKLHAKTDVDEQEIEAAEKSLRETKPLATISKSSVAIGDKDKRTLVALWAEVENGQVHIKGVLPTGEDAIAAAIRKTAKSIAPEHARRQAEQVEDEDIIEGVPDAFETDDAVMMA